MDVLKTTIILCAFALAACAAEVSTDKASDMGVTKAASKTCNVEFMILGAGQDAGAPQISNPNDPAWSDPSKRLLATSAALIDHRSGERYLFEATPDIREQLQMLDEYAPSDKGQLGLSGVFLTHAHIGHYAGLMFFGRESAGANGIPVYAMPKMVHYIRTNGPWRQLVELQNIRLHSISDATVTFLTEDISVRAISVPHRDEYSETVGYVIVGPTKAALFLPDIDKWDNDHVKTHILKETAVDWFDYMFIDATFYDDNELPGRDMSKIPHPRVTETMDMFQDAPETTRNKIHFIHINHTNPIRDSNSNESKIVRERGYNIARRGDRVCLSE